MKQVKRITMLVAAVALAVGALAPLAVASGDNGGSPTVPGSAIFGATAAAVPADVTVALFFDPVYVDTSTGGSGEAVNLQETLVDQGFDVQTFTGVTTAEWTAALASADVLAIPELEEDDGLGDALEPGALAAVQTFISGGGRMTTYVDSAFNFMEKVLGLTPGTLTSDENCPCTKTAAATGTEWAAGPATLLDNNATNTLDIATAPVGSTVIYADDDDADEAGLAVIPLGSGDIVYFGWDWFFDSEETAQFQDWFDVLSETVLANAPAPEPAPEPEPVVVAPRFTG